jgi:magnesium transporter
MITAFILHPDGRTSQDTSPATLTAALRDPKARFWVDLEKPTDEELGVILDEVFGFHPLAIEDTIQYSQRPKIESYNHVGDACQQGYFYLVIHGPDLATFKEKLRTKEVDIFVSERYLVTIHDEVMTSIGEVRQRAQHDPRVLLEPGVDLLLHNILDHLVDHYRPILEYLDVALDELEEEALTKPTADLLTRIAQKKRELLNFRRIIAPQREVLAQLTRGEVPFIRDTTRIYLRDVLDTLVRTVEMIELYRDLVTGARDIYLSTVSNNLNQIMKALTVITVTALPATIITGFFGMNFREEIPGWGWILAHPAGFYGTLFGLIALICVMLFFFRRNKWI